MSTTVPALDTRNLGPIDRDADERSDGRTVLSSYDGSNVVSRLLRMETWGPALMNLGYFPFRGPLATLNVVVNLEGAQRQLVFKSVDLLGVEPRHRVLDLACGRGKSSFIIHCLQPSATVVGVDLLDRNIQVAQTLFDHAHNLSYQTGDAADLAFPDGSFDRLSVPGSGVSLSRPRSVSATGLPRAAPGRPDGRCGLRLEDRGPSRASQ